MDNKLVAKELLAMAKRLAAFPAESSDYKWVSEFMGPMIKQILPMRSRIGMIRQKREWDRNAKGSLDKIIGLLDEVESEMEDLRDLSDVMSNRT